MNAGVERGSRCYISVISLEYNLAKYITKVNSVIA